MLLIATSTFGQELQIDRTLEPDIGESANQGAVTGESGLDSQVAAPAPATRYLLASSARCPVAGCQVENAVIRYDLTSGSYQGVHLANIPGPYGIVVHPKTGRLLVAIRDEHRVGEFDARTGAFIRTFITAGSGGLHNPQNMLFTPQNTLLVTSTPSLGTTGKVNGVLEYNADTGAFIRVFANGGSINPAFPEDCSYAAPTTSCIRGANGIALAANGNVYVASGLNNAVIEFNGTTGAYVGRFVSPYLIEPIGLVVRTGATRPGNLLVTTRWVDPNVQGDGEKVLEFVASTRTLYPNFPILTNGLIAPGAMRFNSAGNLLIMEFIGSISTITADRIVVRHGTNGAALSVFTGTDNHLHGPTAMGEIAYGQAGGDADADLDRDLKDYGVLQRCLSPVTTACRTAFDDDLNGVFAANDFQAFIAGLVGPKLTCTSAAQCDDANPCTTDTCSAGNCLHANVANGTPCPDSSFCDGAEVCMHGICDAQGPCVDAAHCSESLDICVACVTNAECNDNNPCTLDVCVGGATGCTHSPQSGSCNDGNACTLVDFCSGGVCQGGAPRNCNDNNICTADSCSPATGCTYNFNNFLACNDNNVCTFNDFCLSGICNGGDPIPCEDGNICTDDVCVNPFGCQHPNNTNLCNDGNDCTGPDHCSGGSCTSTPLNCDDGIACTVDTCVNGECVNTPNNPSCNDGFFCNGTEVCNPLVGCQSPGNPCTSGAQCANVCNEAADNCFAAAGTACAADGNPCTNDVCNGSGVCGVNNTATCSDNNACTVGDVCANGACQPGTTALTCNDSKPCTDDTCNPATGCVFTPDTSNSCSDNNACNGAEVCLANGNCQAGTPLTCNDSNPCTDDSCNTASGCVFTPDSTNSCSDSNVCNGSETCSAAGACVAGTPLVCNDGKPCTDDSCNPSTGCVFTPDVTNSCADSDACNGAEVCLADGNCQAGTPLTCNDNKPCTDDSCNPASGCVFVNDDSNSCGDGNLCNGAETCSGGNCLPGTPLNCDDGEFCTEDGCDAGLGCTYADKVGACDDGDPCTTGDICDLGECVGGAAPDCDDDNVCTDDSCDPQEGCVHDFNTASCDDGDACTSGDTCDLGDCQGLPVDCDDNDVCTDDSCDPQQGCVYDFNTAACNDGDACTQNDTCGQGDCAGVPVDCDDGEVCTADFCDQQTGCNHIALTGGNCDDGDPCTEDDTCVNGVCQGTPIPGCQACADDPDCDDGDLCDGTEVCVGNLCQSGTPLVCDDFEPCTDNECNPETGCFFPGNTDACNDGDPCTTGDVCGGGSCGGTPIPGCQNCAIDAECDDADVCNGLETCLGGVCQDGTPLDCDDDNFCTTDSCNAASGCANANNTLVCDDGVFCTVSDVCAGGVCQGQLRSCDDSNGCTDDFCDLELDLCVNEDNAAPCDDGSDCTVGDVCSGGSCQPGPVDCDDDDVCTDDSCVGGECINSSNSAPCDDEDLCTENDQCSGGICSGTPVDCDDADVCTADSCDVLTGDCLHDPLTGGACDDGDACTSNDACLAGVCAGDEMPCDDGNECTVDFCFNGICAADPIGDGQACNDNDACTENDQCATGVCTGTPIVCPDDGNPCTDDVCMDAQIGCQHINNTNSCEDGDLCNGSEICSGGACLPGTQPDCDDLNPCTDDSCDAENGCINTNDDTNLCEDGDLCTVDDTCTSGFCSPGAPVNCEEPLICNSTNGMCEQP